MCISLECIYTEYKQLNHKSPKQYQNCVIFRKQRPIGNGGIYAYKSRVPRSCLGAAPYRVRGKGKIKRDADKGKGVVTYVELLSQRLHTEKT